MSVVLDVFEALDTVNIPYCVLRNFDAMYGDELEGDIDVLVPAEQREAVTEIFSMLNWQRRNGDTTKQTRFTTICLERESLIVFDIYWGTATYNGLPFLNGQQVLENRRRYRDIYIPSNEDYFIELVFHSVLNKNEIPAKYQAELERITPLVDAADVKAEARGLFGEPGEKSVQFALEGNFSEMPGMKRTLVIAGLRRSPMSVVSLLFNLIVLREVIRPISRIFQRVNPLSRKPVLAVLGPDGVGKSTTIELTATKLKQDGIEPTIRTMGIHSGGTLFIRSIRAVYNKLTGFEPQTEAIQQGTATLGPRTSEPKAILLCVDFLFRHLSAQVTDADIVLADRYLHELPVYADAPHLYQLVSLVEPDEFFGVVLDDDIDSVAARSELEPGSVEEFYQRLERVRLKRVDVSDGPEEVAVELATVARLLLGRGR